MSLKMNIESLTTYETENACKNFSNYFQLIFSCKKMLKFQIYMQNNISIFFTSKLIRSLSLREVSHFHASTFYFLFLTTSIININIPTMQLNFHNETLKRIFNFPHFLPPSEKVFSSSPVLNFPLST